mmetsp:Transcript_46296/g.131523  ORF Transcript_46296/g.131523 Transcript_46296/m.131523 type:complete len:355 (+) Transcript_46296:856-1920(+)
MLRRVQHAERLVRHGCLRLRRGLRRAHVQPACLRQRLLGPRHVHPGQVLLRRWLGRRGVRRLHTDGQAEVEPRCGPDVAGQGRRRRRGQGAGQRRRLSVWPCLGGGWPRRSPLSVGLRLWPCAGRRLCPRSRAGSCAGAGTDAHPRQPSRAPTAAEADRHAGRPPPPWGRPSRRLAWRRPDPGSRGGLAAGGPGGSGGSWRASLPREHAVQSLPRAGLLAGASGHDHPNDHHPQDRSVQGPLPRRGRRGARREHAHRGRHHLQADAHQHRLLQAHRRPRPQRRRGRRHQEGVGRAGRQRGGAARGCRRGIRTRLRHRRVQDQATERGVHCLDPDNVPGQGCCRGLGRCRGRCSV